MKLSYQVSNLKCFITSMKSGTLTKKSDFYSKFLFIYFQLQESLYLRHVFQNDQFRKNEKNSTALNH